MKEVKEITNHYRLTVGELLGYIEKHNIPMDAKVMVERVEDWYFNSGGWETTNKIQDDGEHQYIESWCALTYKDDNNLYIDCHY